MSASLVGSEMCIRDRIWPPPTANTPGHSQPHRARGVVAAALGAGAGTPVSYTHLTLPTICSV
eukprot:2512874-Alexandrium_andersonii.AAC.1